MCKMTDLSLRALNRGRVKAFQLSPHLLRNRWLLSSASYRQLHHALPDKMDGALLPAANFSLSRNNPLHWQMSGIWCDVPLVQIVQHLDGTSQPESFRGNVRDLANFFCQNMKSGQCFCETMNLWCLLSVVGFVHKQNQNMLTRKPTDFNVFPCSP